MINEELAIPIVEAFESKISTLDAMRDPAKYYLGTPEYKALKTEIDGSAGMVKTIARECGLSELADKIDGGLNGGWGYSTALSATTEVLGHLRNAETLAELRSPQGPKLAMANMHPWVLGAAAQLWDDDHHRPAVFAAAGAIFDVYLPEKVQERKGTDGTAMLRKAFKEPTPFLKLPGFEAPGQDRTNAYEGAQYLGLACVKLVRNLSIHNAMDPGEEPVLLEELAMLSRFARIVSEATA
jgi:hypothetical protein